MITEKKIIYYIHVHVLDLKKINFRKMTFYDLSHGQHQYLIISQI